jgi:branched-chain amino acid aminotransferase
MNNQFGEVDNENFLWQNGEEVEVLTISATHDRLRAGFWLGDGVFETLLFENGKYFALNRHRTRLIAAEKKIGIYQEEVFDQKWKLIESGLASAGLWLKDRVGQVRITTLSDDQIFITAKIHQIPVAPLRIGIYPFPFNERSNFSGVKTISYGQNVQVLRYAKEQGFDDLLLLNSRDEIVESALANFIAFDGKKWVTPHLDSGALAGITRELLIEFFQLEPVTLTLTDLAAMKEMALISSLRDIQAISYLEGISAFEASSYKTPSEVGKLNSNFQSWRRGNSNP